MAILCVKSDYTTIQEAVNAAMPGDTVIVESGVYCESVSVSTDSLRIEGECETVLDGGFELDDAFLLNGASDIRISSFKIKNYIKNGISVTGGGLVCISDCSASDCVESGIYAESSDGLTVINTACSGCGDYGLNFRGLCGTVTQARIESCGEGGMFFFSSPRREVSVSLCFVSDCPEGIEAYGVRLNAGCTRLYRCRNNGIVLRGGDGSSVEKCTLGSCHKTGLDLSGTRHKILRNRLLQCSNGAVIDSGCLVFENDIRQSAALGLVISGTGNTVENNTVTGSGRADIVRYFADNTFLNNEYSHSIPPRLDKSSIIL